MFGEQQSVWATQRVAAAGCLWFFHKLFWGAFSRLTWLDYAAGREQLHFKFRFFANIWPGKVVIKQSLHTEKRPEISAAKKMTRLLPIICSMALMSLLWAITKTVKDARGVVSVPITLSNFFQGKKQYKSFTNWQTIKRQRSLQTSCRRSEVFTVKIILMDIFQCLVDEVHAPQSLWRERNKEQKCIWHLINGPGNSTKTVIMCNNRFQFNRNVTKMQEFAAVSESTEITLLLLLQTPLVSDTCCKEHKKIPKS